MPHYHPHLFRWTEIDGLHRNIGDCCCTSIFTRYIWQDIWLVCASHVQIEMPLFKPSYHSLAIHVERYEKVGGCIEAMRDVVIFLYRRYVRGEGRREDR